MRDHEPVIEAFKVFLALVRGHGLAYREAERRAHVEVWTDTESGTVEPSVTSQDRMSSKEQRSMCNDATDTQKRVCV